MLDSQPYFLSLLGLYPSVCINFVLWGYCYIHYSGGEEKVFFVCLFCVILYVSVTIITVYCINLVTIDFKVQIILLS